MCNKRKTIEKEEEQPMDVDTIPKSPKLDDLRHLGNFGPLPLDILASIIVYALEQVDYDRKDYAHRLRCGEVEPVKDWDTRVELTFDSQVKRFMSVSVGFTFCVLKSFKLLSRPISAFAKYSRFFKRPLITFFAKRLEVAVPVLLNRPELPVDFDTFTHIEFEATFKNLVHLFNKPDGFMTKLKQGPKHLSLKFPLCEEIALSADNWSKIKESESSYDFISQITGYSSLESLDLAIGYWLPKQLTKCTSLKKLTLKHQVVNSSFHFFNDEMLSEAFPNLKELSLASEWFYIFNPFFPAPIHCIDLSYYKNLETFTFTPGYWYSSSQKTRNSVSQLISIHDCTNLKTLIINKERYSKDCTGFHFTSKIDLPKMSPSTRPGIYIFNKKDIQKMIVYPNEPKKLDCLIVHHLADFGDEAPYLLLPSSCRIDFKDDRRISFSNSGFLLVPKPNVTIRFKDIHDDTIIQMLLFTIKAWRIEHQKTSASPFKLYFDNINRIDEKGFCMVAEYIFQVDRSLLVKETTRIGLCYYLKQQ